MSEVPFCSYHFLVKFSVRFFLYTKNEDTSLPKSASSNDIHAKEVRNAIQQHA